MASCLLRDGPKAGQRFELPLALCQDVISVEGGAWFRQEPDGAVSVMKSPRPARGAWIGYMLHVYRKVGRVHKDHVEYTFDRSEDVRRCEAVTKKGQRCLKAAARPSRYCTVHRSLDSSQA